MPGPFHCLAPVLRLARLATPFMRRYFPPRWRALFLVLLVAAGYGREALIARSAMSWAGLPAASDSWNPRTWTRVLRNDGFLVGYSDLRGNPLWVSYQLTAANPQPHHARPANFRGDWRALLPVSPDDYSHSGYDRGHLAPSHAIDLVYGREAQRETFLMTNITPQRPHLNRKLWQRLEEVELDHFLARFGELRVLTGPVFDNHIQRLKTAWRVETPDAFFKIYLVPRADQLPLMLAFVMPQDVKGNEPLDNYLASVDRVEELTGFDFFPNMEDAPERQAESRADGETWNLATVARLPGRYH